MSFLETKSEFNLSAAELLIENDLYAPSIHCSYYSVFQKLKCLYVKKAGISFEDLGVLISRDQRASHKYVIDEFCKFVISRIERRNLKNKINDLKTFRVESDYENVQINHEKSNSALSKSKEILREINRL